MGRELKSAGSNLSWEQQSLPRHSTASLNSLSPWRPLCPSTWWISKHRSPAGTFRYTLPKLNGRSPHSPPPLTHDSPGVLSLREWGQHPRQSLDGHCGFPSLPPSSHPATVPTEPPNNVLKLFLLFHIPSVYYCPICWPTVFDSHYSRYIFFCLFWIQTHTDTQ